jgi:ABC-type transport system involved in multi-copper enzyme maturation permease subunit
MNWLFWKEYRQNRVIVIALFVMLVVPHLFGIFLMWVETHGEHPKLFEFVWQSILCGASLYSLAISQVALALIGGNAIAGERSDRSAEFQVYLPITRKKILAAKLLLAMAIAAVVWLTNPLLAWCSLEYWIQRAEMNSVFMLQIMSNIAVTGLVFFCVAWFFSSFLRSPTFSIVGGLITPAIIISLIAYIVHFIQEFSIPSTETVVQISYWSVCLTVALSSFGVGTWLYLRRVEP